MLVSQTFILFRAHLGELAFFLHQLFVKLPNLFKLTHSLLVFYFVLLHSRLQFVIRFSEVGNLCLCVIYFRIFEFCIDLLDLLLLSVFFFIYDAHTYCKTRIQIEPLSHLQLVLFLWTILSYRIHRLNAHKIGVVFICLFILFFNQTFIVFALAWSRHHMIRLNESWKRLNQLLTGIF